MAAVAGPGPLGWGCGNASRLVAKAGHSFAGLLLTICCIVRCTSVARWLAGQMLMLTMLQRLRYSDRSLNDDAGWLRRIVHDGALHVVLCPRSTQLSRWPQCDDV